MKRLSLAAIAVVALGMAGVFALTSPAQAKSDCKPDYSKDGSGKVTGITGYTGNCTQSQIDGINDKFDKKYGNATVVDGPDKYWVDKDGDGKKDAGEVHTKCVTAPDDKGVVTYYGKCAGQIKEDGGLGTGNYYANSCIDHRDGDGNWVHNPNPGISPTAKDCKNWGSYQPSTGDGKFSTGSDSGSAPSFGTDGQSGSQFSGTSLGR